MAVPQAAVDSRVGAADAESGCPLCGHSRAVPSWLGSTIYGGATYTYVRCVACDSLYCDPMPGPEVLARLYSAEYQNVLADPGDGAQRESRRVIEALDLSSADARGIFVDYGCGRGSLLKHVSSRGWQTIGVEFDAAVAASVAAETGLPVVGPDEARRSWRGRVDVLHLGDVIEHLTEMETQIPAILELLAPGGLLIAQGPLEANSNLFTGILRMARFVTGARVSEMPPYHVLLATAAGQRRLFERFGLHPLVFDVAEVAWPAPARLTLTDLGSVRTTGLFVLRLLSQCVSKVGPRDWGNRYFYVGRRPPVLDASRAVALV